MASVRILGSGDLDEYEIADLLERGAQFDAFGVGTALGNGAGSLAHGGEGGALGAGYKEGWHVEGDGTRHPTVKLAHDKTTWPGLKEVYRHPQWPDDLVK